METKENNLSFTRRRSSLKRKSTFKDKDIQNAVKLHKESYFKRQITWNIDENNTDGESQTNKSSDRSYSDAKTHYSDAVKLFVLYLF